ncbi:MAG: thioesterase [Alteromonadaceae bacterium]|nr:thioesterase [Alteromonadaceae bacterium]
MKLINRCLTRLDSNIHTKVNLVCFPYAGGDSSIFKEWGKFFGKDVAIYAVQLPGRGLRASEELSQKLMTITQEIYQEVSNTLEGDLFLYGHSNGALMALDLACTFHSYKNKALKHLIVSGKNFPDTSEKLSSITSASTPEKVKSLLIDYGATPSELLESPEFLSYYLPIFQSDIVLTQNYSYPFSYPLRCPCSFINAIDDELVIQSQLHHWKNVTEHLKIYDTEGEHFSINSEPHYITDSIGYIITEYLLVKELTF